MYEYSQENLGLHPLYSVIVIRTSFILKRILFWTKLILKILEQKWIQV